MAKPFVTGIWVMICDEFDDYGGRRWRERRESLEAGKRYSDEYFDRHSGAPCYTMSRKSRNWEPSEPEEAP